MRRLHRAMRASLNWWRNDTWVRPFLKQYRRALLASLVLGIGALLFAVGLMFTSGYLISDAAEPPALGLFNLLVPLGLVQVFGIVKPFLSYRERLESHNWVLCITSDLRARLFRTVARKGTFWQATRKTGELLGLLADDIDHVQNLYLRCVFPLVCAWAAWIIVVAAFGAFNLFFALFMLLALGVMCLLMPLASTLVNAGRAQRAKAGTRRLYARLYDDILGLADWGFAQRKADYLAQVEAGAAARDAELDAQRRSLRRFDLATNLLFGAVSLAVLVWAALQFGSTTQAAAATGVAGRPADWIAAFVIGFFPLLEAFAPTCDAAASVHEHRESVERLNDLDTHAHVASDTPDVHDANHNNDNCNGYAPTEAPVHADRHEQTRRPAANNGTPVEDAEKEPQYALPQQPYALAISHLSFTYPGATQETLHDLSLIIEPGQHVAILGPSGCGKSTLLALTRGYLAPSSGNIELGGASVNTLGNIAPRFISIVQQGVYLFNQSLYDNLALGDASITRDAAAQALTAVNLGSLLAGLSHGLDTLVSEAGTNFSGGEAHRIALARVLLRQTPVVLLDEPTVSLDPPTEGALLATIFDTLANRTVVMATHHLAGIEHFDRVIFLDHGRVTLDGTPQHLRETSPRFRKLLAFDRGEIG
jgi:ATP-binding cassette subfamily C protein CydC